jgi:hypothetical protein
MPTSLPAGTAAFGWPKSRRQLPLSRELVTKLSIHRYHPSPARERF